MLTKQAQEEVYNAYYNQGVELALGQVKVAGKTKEVIKKMIQIPSAALAGMSTLDVLKSIPESVRYSIGDRYDFDEVIAPTLAATAGLLGTAGYTASGKAVDLADEGIQKLIKKMKK